MDERRNARLPEGGAHQALPVSTHPEKPDNDAPADPLAYSERVPGLLSEQKARKFGCSKVVRDCEADGGNEECV